MNICQIKKIVTTFSLLLAASPIHSSPINYPVPVAFVRGQTLTANSLNGKLTEIKQAVNDNDSRINTIISNGTGAGGGDITSVSAGFGLKNSDTSNGQSGDIILEIDGVALKTEIITTVQPGLDTKQNNISGRCNAISQKMAGVNPTGSVACVPDNDADTTYSAGRGLKLANTVFTPSNGVATIHAFQFHGSPSCTLVRAQGHAYFTNGNICFLSASIQLPDRATVTSAQCYIYDNNADIGESVSHVKLTRRAHYKTTIHGNEMMANITDSIVSTNIQLIGDTNIVFATVSNANYSYYFDIKFGVNTAANFATNGNQLRLNSCSVNYSY